MFTSVGARRLALLVQGFSLGLREGARGVIREVRPGVFPGNREAGRAEAVILLRVGVERQVGYIG